MDRWACVARLGGIGDNLIAASTLRPLKRMGYKVEVITSSMAQAVYLHNPFIDKLTVKEDGDIPGGPEWQKWFVARAKEYDLFANLSHTCEVRHSCQVGGTQFWARPEYRRKLCAGSFLETVHDVVGVPYDFGPLYFCSEEEKEVALSAKNASIKGDFICWIISGTRIDKIHPYAPYIIARVIKEMGIPILLMGVGTKQHELAEAIRNDVTAHNSSRDGLHVIVSHEGLPEEKRWGVRPSLNLVMQANLVVAPDTGPAWAVAMEPIPKVIMVSHASVENVTKHWVNTITLHADPNEVPCWPCHRLHDDISTCVAGKDKASSACMENISVDMVLEAIDKQWKARKQVTGNVVRLADVG